MEGLTVRELLQRYGIGPTEREVTFRGIEQQFGGVTESAQMRMAIVYGVELVIFSYLYYFFINFIANELFGTRSYRI